MFHNLFFHACKARRISNDERNAVLIKKKSICSGGAASTEAFVTKHAHCVLGAAWAFPTISAIQVCNSKILPNKMCCFAFFWLLKICIVNVIIAHLVEIKLKNKIQASCWQQDRTSSSWRQNFPQYTDFKNWETLQYICRLAPRAPREVSGDSRLERLGDSANPADRRHKDT